MAFEPRRTTMPRKRHKPEEIVAKLRQVDVLVSQGQSVAEAVRSIGVTEVTYYRWRQEFGGLKSDQVKRLKDLETENTRLRRAIADLTLDKLILQEAARAGSWVYPSVAPARRSASIARRSARSRVVETTRSGSAPTSSSLLGSTDATATARSPSCCAEQAGSSTTSGSSGFGDARG